MAPFVESPLFALQSQFDAYQTSAEIKSREPAVVNPYASNLTATLEQSLSLLGAKGKNGAFRECLALRSSVCALTDRGARTVDACWHHSGAWPSLKIAGVTAWEAMKTWHEGGGQRFWKESAPSGFPCHSCCPATHPPACDGGCTSCCGPLWGR